jgi:tripartite-type tricarboxylate transporter receptor subunit TctC
MGNLLIYSAADNFCIWPRALPLPAVARIARAQTYPTRPGRIIVGVSAGGGVDLIARVMGSMAVGAAWPAIRHREPAGRRRQYWHRGGGAGTRGWLYAPPGPCVERNQRDALSGVAPAVTDLLGGQVQTMFNSLPASIEYIKADTLRALAVTTAKRSETLPGIPTMGEFVPGYEASQWYGVGAPKGTPTEIANRLNKEINAGLADAKMKARLADLGGTVLPGSPATFGKLIADETEKWGNVIRALNIKAD